MKRILMIMVSTLVCGWALGQPSWIKKVAKSVFTVKTFAKDGSLLTETNGFYVGDNGVAVSNFSPFRGASKALVIDSKGKEAVVDCILGANDMYDLVKFHVDAKRPSVLPLATSASSVGEQVWLLPYGARKAAAPVAALVKKVETVEGGHSYYTLSFKMPQSATSCPVLNEAGEVIGMLQQPTSSTDTVGYAVSAKIAVDMKISGLSINDPSLKAVYIKKALPDELDQAVLTMYVAPNVVDSAAYVALVNDFVAKFPTAPDGYVYRAQVEAANKKFVEAEADMSQAIKVSDKKDEAHFSYAKLIYQNAVDSTYAPWSFDKAVAETDEAYKVNPMPVYKELKAQILFYQKKYKESGDLYLELTRTNLRNASLFFNAARCKEQLKDTMGMVALLDSAVNTFSKPYLKEAAPYILARAQGLLNAGKAREAVVDFNEYEKLMPVGLNDNFYFIREQAELQGRLYQQALDDMKKAISLSPNNATYYAEKAMIEVKVGLLDDAMVTAGQCIKVAPGVSDGYLFLGLAQCLKGNRSEGVKNLQKAKELGHEQAQEFIDKYSK